MIPRAALTGALLITLATPATWPFGLATFLVRGGLLLVVLPIVALPSPVGLGNLLAPTLMSAVFQGLSAEVALMVGTIVLALVAWIVVGGLMAARLEAEAAWMVARHDDHPGVLTASRRPGQVVRILVGRLLAHLPTGLVLIWGSVRLVTVAYRELTSPLDVTTPILLRVVGGAPEVITAVLLSWTIGEVIGAIAARRIVLDDAGVLRALRDAAGSALRRPLSALAAFCLPTLALLLVIVPSALAAAAAWGAAGVALRSSTDPLGVAVTVVSFVALWIVGLLLIGVTCAWRAAVWSIAHGDRVGDRLDPREPGSG